VLGEAVDRMTHQIEEARAQASAEAAARQRALLQLRRADRLAAVGRTVAVFAHEVGTPLGVIVGRAERLERPVHNDAVRSDARIIHEQGDRIAAFVRRLLDYARHDDGFELAPLDLGASLKRAIPMIADRGRSRGIQVVMDVPGRMIPVEGDGQALEQVMTNLLANAVDASPTDGSVTVRIETTECSVAADRGLPSPHVHIIVEDEGPGVPEELRSRVFDPFFSTKEPGQGTGLGLAIVAEIVQDHGGQVTLEDRIGGGCRVVVHLPAGGPRG
jgi:signal transduction histidine kinase